MTYKSAKTMVTLCHPLCDVSAKKFATPWLKSLRHHGSKVYDKMVYSTIKNKPKNKPKIKPKIKINP